MTNKTVYQFDLAGLYIGDTIADESPLEPGVFHLPARTTEIAPPAIFDGFWPRWNGSGWGQIKMKPKDSTDPLVIIQAQIVALQAQLEALKATA